MTTSLTILALLAAAKTVPVVEPIIKTPPLARVVQYGMRDTVRINTRPLYTTLIVLPEKERIIQILCGDKDFWQVTHLANHASAKPAEGATKTVLHLITAANNAYTFELVADPKVDPDFKLFVEPKDDAMLASLKVEPKFVEASQLATLREEIDQWRAESFRLRKEQAAKIEEVKAKVEAEAPAAAKHEYKFRSHEAPFNIQGIWHDGKFTYIQAKPQELPALYEKRDGKGNLIQFRFDNDLYIAEKVLENGYLKIGKKTTEFYRVAQ